MAWPHPRTACLLLLSAFGAPASGAGAVPAFADYVRGVTAPPLASIHKTAFYEGWLFLAEGSRIYRSRDSGSKWEACPTVGLGYRENGPLSVAAFGTRLWMLASGSFLLYSDDAGASWRTRNPLNPFGGSGGLVKHGESLIAWSGLGGLRLGPGLTDWADWKPQGGGGIHTLVSAGGWLYALMDQGDGMNRVERLRDPGENWSPIDAGLPPTEPLWPERRTIPLMELTEHEGTLYALGRSEGYGMYALPPGATRWIKVSGEFPYTGSEAPEFFRTATGPAFFAGDSLYGVDAPSAGWRGRAIVAPGRGPIGSVIPLGSRWLAIRDGMLIQSRDQGIHWSPVEMEVPPPQIGESQLVSILDWNGRLNFLYSTSHHQSDDGGASWRTLRYAAMGADSMPWYPHPVATQSATREKLAIFLRGPNYSYIRDRASGKWAYGNFPRAKVFVSAQGADADRFVCATVESARETFLESSRDGGISWSRFPGPDYATLIAAGRIQVEGNAILLLGPVGTPEGLAATLDDGRTWRDLPDSALARLSGGCLHWIVGSALHSVCGPEQREAISLAPFPSAQALFVNAQGTLFALADSALYTSAAGEGARAWRLLADKAAMRGWQWREETISRHRNGKVEWFDPDRPASLAARGARKPASKARGQALKNQGKWYIYGGSSRDARGRRPGDGG